MSSTETFCVIKKDCVQFELQLLNKIALKMAALEKRNISEEEKYQWNCKTQIAIDSEML